eukprot:gene1276-biopygen1114
MLLGAAGLCTGSSATHGRGGVLGIPWPSDLSCCGDQAARNQTHTAAQRYEYHRTDTPPSLCRRPCVHVLASLGVVLLTLCGPGSPATEIGTGHGSGSGIMFSGVPVTETGSGPGLFMSLVLVLIQNCGLRCGRRRAGEHRTDAMVSFHLFGRYLEDGAVERFVPADTATVRTQAVYWVRTGETCDWMWANSEYRRGKQPRCPARHSPLHPCWAVCWSGAYFYGNPPFDLLTVERTIRKANRDFVKDPEHTVFRFIAPHAHLRTLAPLLVHWEVLHTYPTGSQGVFNYRRDGTYSGAPPVPTTEPEEQLRLRCLEHRYLTRLRSPRDGGSALLHLRRGVEKSGSNSVRAYRV